MNDDSKYMNKEVKCLIVVHSYHHNNTRKIADEFSKTLHSVVETLETVDLETLKEYDLIGFGAGIDSGQHYKPLIDLVDKIPNVDNKKSFIFSTSAMQGAAKVEKDHLLLKQKLEAKGYKIVGEFSCKGFDTNSILKYIGGLNKGRPNSTDLKNAESFALKLLKDNQ
jgi:flavodoxin